MSLYAGTFIDKIRLRTDNQTHSEDANGVSTEGVPNSLILDYINEAKDFIQTAIVSTGSLVCDDTSEIDIVADTAEYEIADNVHLSNKVRNVKYSTSGQARDYINLPRGRDEDLMSYSAGDPSLYVQRGSTLILVPIPDRSGAKIKPLYPRQWDAIDLRRGTVSAHTTYVNGKLRIDLANDSVLDSVALSTAQYVCVVTAFGVVTQYNIPVLSYNSTLFQIQTDIAAGTTIDITNGDYIVVGAYATSHIALPSPLIEQYVKIETQMRLFDKESSIDALREDKALKTRFDAIIEGYEDEILDDTDLPIDDEYCLT